MPELGYNTSEVSSSGAIPNGDYSSVVSQVEVKGTQKAGDAHVLTLQIVDGPHKGSEISHQYFCVNHSNELASRIARQGLKALSEAVGKPDSTNTDDLIGVPITISLSHKMNDSGFPDYKFYVKSSQVKAATQGAIPGAVIPQDVDDDIPF
jgi:hypothetical protein